MNAFELAVAVFHTPAVLLILALIAANVLSGLAVAFYTQTFRLAVIADWLISRALPYILGDATVQVALLAGATDSGISAPIGTLVHAFVVAALIGHIVQNLREIGMPFPATLGG